MAVTQSADSVDHFAELLNSNFPPTRLCIIRCKVTTHSLQEIVSALKVNRSVTYLDLWSNDIDDEGAKILASLIKMNDKLTCLNISNNYLTKTGAGYLAEALKHSNSLTALFLEHSNFDVDVAEVFLEPLADNRLLRSLKLSPTQQKQPWKANEDIITINKFLKENKAKLQSIGNMILRHHNLRYSFKRQKLVFLGATNSGKSLLFDNLNNYKPIDKVYQTYKRPSGLEFDVSTSLTSFPYFNRISEVIEVHEEEDEEEEEDFFAYPDMLMEAVLRLTSKVLDIDFYKKNDHKFRESYIEKTTQIKLRASTVASSTAISNPPAETQSPDMVQLSTSGQQLENNKHSVKRNGVETRRVKGNRIVQKSTKKKSQTDVKLLEFQKLAFKFAKREVRDIRKKEMEARHNKMAKKLDRGETIKATRMATKNVNVLEHIKLFDKSLKSKEKLPASPKMQRKVRNVKFKKNPEFVKSFDTTASSGKQVMVERNDILPLKSQSPFDSFWFYERRGQRKYLNYTSVEVPSDKTLHSFNDVIFPQCHFGMYVICFDLSLIQKGHLLVEKLTEPLAEVHYWLGIIIEKLYSPKSIHDFAQTGESRGEAFNKRILLVGTNKDKLELKEDSIEIILKTNTYLRKLLKDFKKKYRAFSLDSIVRNERENILFFGVDNISGKGIKAIYNAIQKHSNAHAFVRKSVELRQLKLFDEIRCQELFKDNSNLSTCLTQKQLEKKCTQIGVDIILIPRLMKLFNNSGLGYYDSKNQILFRDYRIVAKMYNFFFFANFSVLGKEISITKGAIAELEYIITEQYRQQNQSKRIPYSDFRWGSCGQHFADLLKHRLLICTIHEKFIFEDTAKHLNRTELAIATVSKEEDDEEDSLISQGEEGADEKLFIPKFLEKIKIKIKTGRRAIFDLDPNNKLSAETVYHSLLCKLLPSINDFTPKATFVLGKPACLIALEEIEFYIVIAKNSLMLISSKRTLDQGYFVLSLIRVLIESIEKQLVTEIKYDMSFEERTKAALISEEKAREKNLKPWFSATSLTTVDALLTVDAIDNNRLHSVYEELNK